MPNIKFSYALAFRNAACKAVSSAPRNRDRSHLVNGAGPRVLVPSSRRCWAISRPASALPIFALCDQAIRNNISALSDHETRETLDELCKTLLSFKSLATLNNDRFLGFFASGCVANAKLFVYIGDIARLREKLLPLT